MTNPKCTRTTECPAMQSRLEDGPGRTGFYRAEVANLKTNKIRYIGVVYRKPKLKPILLNFCPWCGASIDFTEKKSGGPHA